VPDNVLTGTSNTLAPEFQIYSTLTTIRRHNFTNTMLNPNGAVASYGITPSAAGPDRIIPDGTKLNLTTLEAMAPNPTNLINEIDRVMFGNRMSAAMRSRLIAEVDVVTMAPLRRVKTALYLVVNAPEWLVQR
jgi:hypothetical protein